jgi:hypothetical protein
VATEPDCHHRPLAAIVAAITGRTDPRFPAVPGRIAADRIALLEAMAADPVT